MNGHFFLLLSFGHTHTGFLGIDDSQLFRLKRGGKEEFPSQLFSKMEKHGKQKSCVRNMCIYVERSW